MISPEEIEWFQQNSSLVSQERRALRERLLKDFENMQTRMVLAASQNESGKKF